MNSEETFTDIYRDNSWGNTESCSGPGSTVFRTRLLRPALVQLLRDLEIKSVLDAGCGDFNWMRLADFSGISYIGVDIVSEIVQRNSDRYSASSRRFVCLDLTHDPLPEAECVLCRDCLVHFSYSDIDRALWRMRSSGARYLLATTFDANETNCDIATGGWRPLNLEKPPFSFPPPIRKLWDGPRDDGSYPDKMLSLYEWPNYTCMSRTQED
jgi:SAM-dependent methyltransferase